MGRAGGGGGGGGRIGQTCRIAAGAVRVNSPVLCCRLHPIKFSLCTSA